MGSEAGGRKASLAKQQLWRKASVRVLERNRSNWANKNERVRWGLQRSARVCVVVAKTSGTKTNRSSLGEIGGELVDGGIGK